MKNMYYIVLSPDCCFRNQHNLLLKDLQNIVCYVPLVILGGLTFEDLPMHVSPSPVYPILQMHEQDPKVFTQSPQLQLCVPREHSSISVQLSPLKPTLHSQRKEPLVFWQVECEGQTEGFSRHSSISVTLKDIQILLILDQFVDWQITPIHPLLQYNTPNNLFLSH